MELRVVTGPVSTGFSTAAAENVVLATGMQPNEVEGLAVLAPAVQTTDLLMISTRCALASVAARVRAASQAT
jgi:hypothetical protein